MVFNYFPRLKERSKQIAGTLSGGEQRMWPLARALIMTRQSFATGWKEPSMECAPILVDEIFL